MRAIAQLFDDRRQVTGLHVDTDGADLGSMRRVGELDDQPIAEALDRGIVAAPLLEQYIRCDGQPGPLEQLHRRAERDDRTRVRRDEQGRLARIGTGNSLWHRRLRARDRVDGAERAIRGREPTAERETAIAELACPPTDRGSFDRRDDEGDRRVGGRVGERLEQRAAPPLVAFPAHQHNTSASTASACA